MDKKILFHNFSLKKSFYNRCMLFNDILYIIYNFSRYKKLFINKFILYLSENNIIPNQLDFNDWTGINILHNQLHWKNFKRKKNRYFIDMKTFDKILHFEILYKGKQIIFIQYQNHLAERFFQIKYQDKTIILYLIKAILLQNIKFDSYIIYRYIQLLMIY